MREFIDQNGQPAGWHVMSAFEARMIGRAAVIDDPNEASTAYIRHNGAEDTTNSEVIFAAREARYGRLIIGRSVARHAEQAFRQIADINVGWNGISPDVAKAFVALLDYGLQESREINVPIPPDNSQSPEAIVVEVPDLSGPINATGHVKQAA